MIDNFSVLMSIHIRISRENLIESINSLVAQTLKPSEIVIVKDGPLNFSLDEVCKSIDFKNFKIIDLKTNKGLAFALNEGLKNCSFELIARMDSDDISYLNRFFSFTNMHHLFRNRSFVPFSGPLTSEPAMG